jgi:hypothetical protein
MNRDLGVIALGRFLAVERSRESHQSSSSHHLRGPGADRTGGHASQPGPRRGSRVPAWPHHG